MLQEKVEEKLNLNNPEHYKQSPLSFGQIEINIIQLQKKMFRD